MSRQLFSAAALATVVVASLFACSSVPVNTATPAPTATPTATPFGDILRPCPDIEYKHYPHSHIAIPEMSWPAYPPDTPPETPTDLLQRVAYAVKWNKPDVIGGFAGSSPILITGDILRERLGSVAPWQEISSKLQLAELQATPLCYSMSTDASTVYFLFATATSPIWGSGQGVRITAYRFDRSNEINGYKLTEVGEAAWSFLSNTSVP